MNPQYEDIGKGFVQQYYLIFDDAAQRPNLVNLYNVSKAGPKEPGLSLAAASEHNLVNQNLFCRRTNNPS